jgi:hypothetical protein
MSNEENTSTDTASLEVEDRTELRGVSDVLNKVAVKLQYVRSERGRFFINEWGAFFKDESGEAFLFVRFVWEAKGEAGSVDKT